MAVDPLTCDRDCLPTKWPRDEGWNCTLCGANELQLHSETCPWSPIYAELYDPEIMCGIQHDFTTAIFNMEQHIIPCAICGKVQYGKYMDTVWQAHPGSVTVQSEWEVKHNIKNIVKAVCCRHNRKGSVSWRYAGVTD